MAQFATHDQEEALDLVQDAMFKLVRRYAHRPEPEWPPLFYRILHNGIQDWHRRNWVRSKWRIWMHTKTDHMEEGDDDPIESISDESGLDPLKQMEHRRAGQALEQALQQLPLRQRQAFLLRAWEGLSVTDTAGAMGCSEGSVKTHYSRAIHTLRDKLADHRL